MSTIHELSVVASQTLTKITPGVIEKDFYVTQIIHILTHFKNPDFDLVFSGGTCLAKGHHVIQRMSEDVDFKVVLKAGNAPFSNSALRNKLRTLRTEIIDTLQHNNFKVAETMIKVRNAGEFFQIFVDYPTTFPQAYSLRQNILLEFTYDTIACGTEALPIASLIAETLKIEDGLEKITTPCAKIIEIAAEKWVSITRRIAAVERGHIGKDKVLIRHLYDLSQIEKLGVLNQDYYDLIAKTIQHDRKKFQNQHPEYVECYVQEIDRSIQLLIEDTSWKDNYNNFIQDMVYAQQEAPPYPNCLALLQHIRRAVAL